MVGVMAPFSGVNSSATTQHAFYFFEARQVPIYALDDPFVESLHLRIRNQVRRAR